MTVRADDRGGAWFKTRPSVAATLARLSWDEETVWWKLRMYCARSGYDGDVPRHEVHVAVDRKITEAKALKVADALATKYPELVERVTVDQVDVYRIARWLEDNPSAETWHDPVKLDRWKRAKALSRDRALCGRIKSRDRNLCRYCGIRVDWNNRNGAAGGTYDHIDPDGENDESNVAVACRRCNGRKRDRTPQQAGMTLLKPGTTADQIAPAARGPAPPGPAPGQPQADPEPAPATRTRARPDRAEPGLAAGQPEPTHPPIGFARAFASVDDRPPPHTDSDAPPEVHHP